MLFLLRKIYISIKCLSRFFSFFNTFKLSLFLKHFFSYNLLQLQKERSEKPKLKTIFTMLQNIEIVLLYPTSLIHTYNINEKKKSE